jgi:hypothetical protein
MQLDFDITSMVEAESYALLGCTCGCQQMKFFMLDKNRKAIAVASFRCQDWLPVSLAATRGFVEMAIEASKSQPLVADDGDRPLVTH